MLSRLSQQSLISFSSTFVSSTAERIDLAIATNSPAALKISICDCFSDILGCFISSYKVSDIFPKWIQWQPLKLNTHPADLEKYRRIERWVKDNRVGIYFAHRCNRLMLWELPLLVHFMVGGNDLYSLPVLCPLVNMCHLSCGDVLALDTAQIVILFQRQIVQIIHLQ